MGTTATNVVPDLSHPGRSYPDLIPGARRLACFYYDSAEEYFYVYGGEYYVPTGSGLGPAGTYLWDDLWRYRPSSTNTWTFLGRWQQRKQCGMFVDPRYNWAFVLGGSMSTSTANSMSTDFYRLEFDYTSAIFSATALKIWQDYPGMLILATVADSYGYLYHAGYTRDATFLGGEVNLGVSLQRMAMVDLRRLHRSWSRCLRRCR